MSDGITPIPTPVQGKSSLYTHPDPLLRRLRLEDPYGRPIETLKRDLAGKEVIIFYVGSVHGSETLTDLNKDLINLALRQPKTCSIIYVPVDTTQSAIEAVVKNKPFLRMSLLDNSDFAAMETADNKDQRKRVALDEVLRDEDFITAEEYSAGGIKINFGKEEDENEYVRPISRAALAQIANAYGTPSLAVYHVPTHQFLSKNTRHAQFRSERIGTVYKEWKNGGHKTGVADLWDVLKYPTAVVVGGIIYSLFRLFGGEQWNVLPQIFQNLEVAEPKTFPSLSVPEGFRSMGLPKATNGGILPYWLAFTSVLSVFNTIQTFVSPALSKRIYGKKPEEVTGVGRRTFGVWTLLAAALRMYTAYEIENTALYNLSIVSYVIAGFHFFTELLVYKTASFGPGALSPVVVASSSLAWLLTQRNYYLGV